MVLLHFHKTLSRSIKSRYAFSLDKLNQDLWHHTHFNIPAMASSNINSRWINRAWLNWVLVRDWNFLCDKHFFWTQAFTQQVHLFSHPIKLPFHPKKHYHQSLALGWISVCSLAMHVLAPFLSTPLSKANLTFKALHLESNGFFPILM
jgi:hypothetical protein